jgi:hypothetical protein
MGLDNFKRKNLKISKPVFQILSEEKNENETWDGFFERILDERNSRQQKSDIKSAVREVLREEEIIED